MALSAGPALAASLTSDTFDGGMSAQFVSFVDPGAGLSVTGGAGTIDFGIGASSDNDDALMLSRVFGNPAKNFTLPTDRGFTVSIDFDADNVVADGNVLSGVSAVLGVGRDLDGRDSAAAGFTWSPLTQGYAYAGRIDDSPIPPGFLAAGGPGAGNQSGTISLSFDPGLDKLNFAITLDGGGGAGSDFDPIAPNADWDGDAGVWYAAPGNSVIDGLASGDTLLVSFGVRVEGGGFTGSGTVRFDNLVVDIDAIPTPTALPAGAGAMLWLTRRRR